MAYKYTSYVYDSVAGQWTSVSGMQDYNQLSNQPVKNIVGSSAESFVNLAGLDYGRYVVSGYFKFDSTYDVELLVIPMDVLVLRDNNSNKVITYPTIENGICVTNVITYDSGLVISQDKQAPGVQYWKSFE